MNPASKFRAWCFTLNNYTDQDEQHIQNIITSFARYVVYGRELAPRPELHTYKDMCTSTTNANAKRSRGCFLVRAWTWLTARRNKTVTTAQRMETSSNSEICQLTLTQQEREEEQLTPRDTPTPWNSPERETWTRLESPIHRCSSYMVQDWNPCMHPKLVRSKATYNMNGGSALPVQGSLGYYGNYTPSTSRKRSTSGGWIPIPRGRRYRRVVAKNDLTASALKKWADRYPFPGEIKGDVFKAFVLRRSSS